MSFHDAIQTIKAVLHDCGTVINANDYDGVIVKKLAASNTLDEGRTTNQTHIAITGEQMDIFPYLCADGYFYDSDTNADLKKYFIIRIKTILTKSNCDYLGGAMDLDFTSEYLESTACVVRSKRASQNDQLQLSMLNSDGKEFVAFRKLLHEGAYLIVLKCRGSMNYHLFGVNSSEGNEQLKGLNNKFFRADSQTIVDIDTFETTLIDAPKEVVDLTYLPKLGNTEFAENAFSVMIKYELIDDVEFAKLTDPEWSKRYIKRILPIIKEIPVDCSDEELQAARKTDGPSHNRYYDTIHKIGDVAFIVSNNWFENEDRGYNKTAFTKHIADLLEQKGYDVVFGKNSFKGCNELYYGVPGAGKSHKIDEIIKDSRYERVVFHPDYTYSDFVGQIIPRIKTNKMGEEKLSYEFVPGPFIKALAAAENDPNHMFYLVIEEINRGNAPAIFGDVFQLLDRDENGNGKYMITNFDIAKAVYDDENHEVRIPSNLTILATMNTSDQNVFTLDTAFQRRWNMKYIKNDVNSAKHANEKIQNSNITWGQFANTINKTLLDYNSGFGNSEDKQLGAYFVSGDELTVDKFPEKTLKYLWDDAFKMDHDVIFRSNIKSIGDIVVEYHKPGDPLERIMRKEIYEQMIKTTMEKMENVPLEVSVDEEN